jgi:hypothetical protein
VGRFEFAKASISATPNSDHSTANPAASLRTTSPSNVGLDARIRRLERCADAKLTLTRVNSATGKVVAMKAPLTLKSVTSPAPTKP